MEKLKIHNSELVPFAKSLRKNMTKEEKHLWYDYLKGHTFRFIRQKIFGKYIADFYCAKAKLVLELDGAQHYEEEAIELDKERTEFLERTYGLKVLRILNKDVNKNFHGVCEYIDEQLKLRMNEHDV